MTINLDLLDDESAIQTIETVGKLADENNIDWALAGGLAVILYGGDRLTKDVDIIASKKLPLKNEGILLQGGERYISKQLKESSRLIGLRETTKLKNFIIKP
ncbi:MAG: hypothetical protein ABJA66_07255 [Actinomycetota bacterium]